MVNLPNGDATLLDGPGEPDFYDVIVRYPGDDPLDEIEDIQEYAEAQMAVQQMLAKYPGAHFEELPN